jgi:hypothetical protein
MVSHSRAGAQPDKKQLRGASNLVRCSHNRRENSCVSYMTILRTHLKLIPLLLYTTQSPFHIMHV